MESHFFGLTDFERIESGEIDPIQQTGENTVMVLKQLPGSPDYGVVATFFVSDRGPQLFDLSIKPWSYEKWPPTTLTTEIIRSVPLDRLYEDVHYAVMNWRQPLNLDLDIDLREFKRNPRPGRRGRADIFYARIAADYVELLATSSTPTKDLAKKHHYGESQMRDFLNKARTRGLLTRPERGRAGGQLTQKGRDLLAKSEGSK